MTIFSWPLFILRRISSVERKLPTFSASGSVGIVTELRRGRPKDRSSLISKGNILSHPYPALEPTPSFHSTDT